MSDIIPNVVVSMPSQLFTLARKFQAASNGKIFIGKIDTDPTLPENQIQVYLENEDGSHIPVPQPLIINQAGFPVYNGQIAKFVTVEGHSMAVYDSYGAQQHYHPNVLKYDPDQLRQELLSPIGASLIGTHDGNNVQDELEILKLGQVKITDFGAIAGQDCSDAFELAFKTGKTVIVPDTSYDKPWIITRNIQLPLVAKIIGNSPAFPFGYKERFEFNGPYIQFKGGSFICGDGVISRVFLYCKNLMLMGRYGADINDKSILDNAGVAFNGTAGGYLDNISFAGLQYAMINDYSYFLNMSNIRANNNYWVFKLNDFNSSSIENYFGSYNTIHIDLGEDAARSSLRNIGINMNTGTKVGVRFEGGVSLDGYIYFENFGTPASGSVCLAVNFGRYSQRSINISNVLFHANLCDYAMTIGATTNNNVRISGKFDCCDWYEPKIAKIGFGVTPRFNGEPTYPTAVIKDINFDTHAGLSLSDIQKPSNSPYRKWMQSPFGSWRETKNIDISGPSYKNIQLSSDNLVDSNVLFDYDEGKIIIPNDGVYNISLSATLSNVKSEYHRGARIDILLNGAIISSSLTSINRPDSGASYSNISTSVSRYITSGSSIHIRGMSGDGVYNMTLSINKVL
ncbi:bifunctional tail protein [Proteus mirabilis]|uniref:phage head-binding domain-containing protein n=1 Tax=Proteus mirabilis TaxID=584 RepID=UPI000502D106|nr:phage head-binding domain-containing protein [Proteus mirabilis]KGA90494.1 bifunctional tail protein [Proteus mirabilis]UGO54323.1 putative head binding protein [Proteus phage vB_PmiP_Brookers]